MGAAGIAFLAFGAVAGILALVRPCWGRGILRARGVPDYQITQADILELARAGAGEAGTNPQGVAAVLWALANHYMRVPAKRPLYPSLGGFARAYCTPLHAGRVHSTMPWSQIPQVVRETTTKWAKGCVPSPIGGRTDWRASWAGYNPSDAVNVGGNVFGTHDRAQAITVRLV